MDKKTFIVYSDWEDKLSLLSDEELGKIFRYIFKYVKTGSIPKMKRELLMIFNILKIINNSRFILGIEPVLTYLNMYLNIFPNSSSESNDNLSSQSEYTINVFLSIITS